MPHINRLTMALIVSLFFWLVFTGTALSVSNMSKTSKAVSYRQAVRFYRTSTWHWQTVMGVSRTRSAFQEKKARNTKRLHWLAMLWKHRSIRAKHHARNVPHKADWLCIHRHEGAWNDHTGNGYYGGLQMDLTFQRRYGGYLLRVKGTANNWSPLEQMWIAERAFESGRGFYPWPNTARACGLI